MENIYYGESKKKCHKVNLMDLLLHSLRENGFKAQQDQFGDESATWIELIKTTNKPSQITVNILFDCNDRNKITDISIFEAPIVTIVDEEKSLQLVRFSDK